MRRVLMTPSSVGGVAKAKVDLDVAAIDPAQFLQALYQLPDQGLPFWLALREHTQKSDARHRAGLPPSRRERPRGCRAAECSQQFPPSDGDCHTPLPCEVRRKRYHATSALSLTARQPGRAGRHA